MQILEMILGYIYLAVRDRLLAAAIGICSIPPLPEAADAGGVAAEHASTKEMAQAITLAELIITTPIILSACVPGQLL